MTVTPITPTIQSSVDSDLRLHSTELGFEIKKALNCVRVGIVQSFNAANQTAVIQIAQQQITSVSPLGVRTTVNYSPLVNVPVQYPSGGGFTLTFPIAEGDECLVLFNDRELDNWFISGGITVPTTYRVHDLSDGIAIVGIRNSTRSLASVSTTSTQLRSDDGQTYIDLSSGKIQLIADEVVIHGRNKITFDAGGTGFAYTPSQIDTYTNGVTVVTHSPDPPEIPT